MRIFLNGMFVNRLVVGSVIFVLAVNPALAALQNPAVPTVGVTQSNRIQKQNPVAVEPAQLATVGVVLDANNHQTELKQASNGTTVVDIAAPTAKGVSQNNFSEFNVDASGIIFNNSKGPVLTQLGGWSDGNRRLAGGTAKIILTQVTGNNRSQLQGQVEIAGQAADFILANANGITCNGCGFINTPRVSLITGNANYAADGSLGFNILGGDVAIEGQGLNATNISRFDIITRAAKINAAIYADQLNVIAGKNAVDYNSGSVNALSDATNTTTPLFAIDSSLLGGMYGNNIRLIGTEKGLGVNTEGLVQSVGDLEITADGDIQLKTAQANQKVAIRSASGSITNEGIVYGKEVSLFAKKDLLNQNLLAAEQELKLTGTNFNQFGSVYAGLKADNTLSGQGNSTINLSGAFNNSQDFFVAGSVNLSIGLLNNSGAFVLQSEKNIAGIVAIKNTSTLQFNSQDSVALVTNSLDNQNGVLSYSGAGAFNLNVLGDFNNTQGILSSNGNLNITANNIDNTSGVMSAKQAQLQVGSLNNKLGTLETSQLNLTGSNLNNQEGVITAINNNGTSSGSSLVLSGELNNQSGVVYFNNGQITNSVSAKVAANSIQNSSGLLIFANQMPVNISSVLDIDNQLGLIQSGNLNITGTDLQNSSGQIIASNGSISVQSLVNDAGQLQADKWSINADKYSSAGGVILATAPTAGGISLHTNQDITQSAGAVIKSQSGDVTLTANNILNTQSVISLLGDGKLSLSASRLTNTEGAISSTGNANFSLADLNNGAGYIDANGLLLNSTTVTNTSGVIKNTGSSLQVNADSLDNQLGVISSQGELDLNLINNFINQQGVVNGEGKLTLTASNLLNQSGSIVSATDLNLNQQQILNDQGQLIATNSLNISSSQFNNGAGLVSAKTLNLNAQAIDVGASGSLQAEHLTLNAPQINNSGFIFSNGAESSDLSILTQLLHNKGTLEAASFDWDLSSLNLINDQGTLVHDGQGELKLGSIASAIDFDNSNSVIATQGTLSLSAKSIKNTYGTLIARNGLNLQLTDLNNQFGVLQSGGDFSLNAANLNNSNGSMVLNGDAPAVFNIANQLDNQQGTIVYSGASGLTLNTTDILNNSGKIISQSNLTINNAGKLENNLGLLSAAKRLELNTNSQNNQGELSAGDLVLNAVNFNNRGGSLVANSVSGIVSKFDNQQGLLQSDLFDLALQDFDNSNKGQVFSTANFSSAGAASKITAKNWNNNDGSLAVKQITLIGDSFNNQKGTLTADTINLQVTDLDNSALGTIAAVKSLSIQSANFKNQNGLVQSGGADVLNINSAIIDNTAGSIASLGTGTLSITADQLLQSNTSEIYAKNNLLISLSGDFDNKGSIQAENILDITVSNLSNSQVTSNLLAKNILIKAKDTNNTGYIEAEQIRIDGTTATNAGTMISTATAGQAMQFNLTGNLVNLGALENNGTDWTLSRVSNQGTIQLTGIGLLDVTDVDNKTTGKIYSNGNIKISGDLKAGTFNNAGIVSAVNNLDIAVANTNNQNGQLVAGSMLSATGKTLNNQSGIIVSNATTDDGIQFNLTGQLNNSINGQIESASTNWTLQNLSLNNSGGTINHLGFGTFTLNLRGDLANSGGQIQSVGNLNVNALDSNASVINNQGLLRGKAVNVSASNSILNTGLDATNFGEISGASLSLSAANIDNTFGRLISNDPANGSITFNTPNVIKNISGVMSSSAKDWQLNLDQFDNTNGSILHDGSGTLTLNSAYLLNNAGTISSIANVVVNSIGLDNSGNLIADKNLSLNSSGNIANQLSGRISANGNLSINANNIAKIDFYNAGEINSLNQIDLNIGSGDVYNTGSLVFSSASNPWKINSLTNSGYISYNGSSAFQLTGSSITNSGTLLSKLGSLNFTAASITNNKDIIANQFNAFGVSIFKNTSGALLSSNQIQINNAQTINGLFENDGTVETAGVTNSLQVYTTQFSNLVNGEITTNSNNQVFYGDFTNAGVFTHAGAGNLELGKSGALIIAANSEINSAGLIKVSNSISGPGKIYSSAGIDIDTGSQTFINSGATFYTTKNLSIYSGVDNQTNGQLVSDGTMVINTAGVVTNSGLIQGQSLQLTASSLTNNKEIFSVGGLSGQISVQSLTNAGTIGSSSAQFSISTTNGSLTNTSAGIINVESGLSLSAINNDINNQGLIQSNGSLTINKNANVTNQLINNGIIIGDTLDFNLNKIDNRFGTINATGSALSSLVTTATTVDAFNNINGKIFANSTNFTISSSGAFDNSSGQVNHYGNGALTFTTQSFATDSSSKILSNGSIDLTVANQLNNAGEISALNLNHIKANNLVNTGVIGSRAGEVKLDLASYSLINTSGTINGFQKLTIDAQSIGNSASLESSNDIQIATNGFSQVGNINSNNLLSITLGKGDLNLTSSDSIKVPGSLSITLSESGRGFNNNGTISSVNAMTLTGSYLNNYAGAHIDVGNGVGLLDITGDIYNEGIISAKQNLLINANNFINTSGAEVISGKDLAFSLANGNFTNDNIIFSAGNIDVLGAQNIFNNSRAEIRSLGNLSLSASDSIINTEARIESGGNMALSAPNRIENNSTPAVISFSPFSFQVDLNGFAYPDPYYNQVVLLNGPYIDEIDKGTVSNSSSIITAKIYANGDLNLEGGSSAIVKNNEGEIFAGGNIVLNANTWVGLSTAEGFYSRRIELNGTAGWIICTPVGSSNCITTPAYYWRGTPIISTLISTSRLFGFTHANGNVITSLSNVINDNNFVISSGSNRTPNNTGGLTASNNTGGNAGNKIEVPVDVNGQLLNGGSTNAGNYNGATVTLADLTAGVGANGKGGANASGVSANQQNGNATQGINYLNSIDANQLQALAKTDALNKLLAQLNGGNLTQQQLLDLINQIRSGQNPFTTDQELQNFLANVNGWFDANLSESDKELLAAQSEMSAVAAKAKAQQGNTQAPTLIQVNILPYGFNLNNLSGLFVVNSAPDSRYLIETRPEFTQYTNFLGSDYLLTQLGLDPDKTQKRLGDAFFENQLIKESLMRDLSLRYLDGALDDFSMMQILMDNAVHQNASLHLSVGVELSPEQCAHLTEDMLWLVEKTVKGQKVLVPHLYLTSVSKDKLEASNSALAAGGTLELTAKNGISNNSKIVANNLLMSTQGSLDQNGTLIAHGDIRLLADKNIRNIGKITGGNVNLLAQGDVTNKGSITANKDLQIGSTQGSVINTRDGQLKAGDTLSLLAKNDIKNQHGTLEGNDVSLYAKTGDIVFDAPAAGNRTGDKNELIVRNNLQMEAGHNLELQGANIKAENNINLRAGNDVNLTAIETKTSWSKKSKGKSASEEIITHDVASLEATNGNVVIDAGHDVNLQATQVTAGKTIALKAANDVNLLAVEDSTASESSTTATKRRIDGLGGVARTSMGLGGKPGVLSVNNTKVSSLEKNSESNFQVVDLNAGNGVSIEAGHDANLQGTQIKAVGDISIAAKNDLNFNAVENKQHSEIVKKNKKVIDDKVEHTLVNIDTSGGGVQLVAGNDANLIGTNVAAEKNISIHAERDTNISAVVDSTYHYDKSKKTSGGVLNKKTKTIVNESLSETAVGGNISGDNVLINAHVNTEGDVIGDKSGNVNLLGANITAKSNLIISADEDVNASGIQTQENEYHQTKKSGSFGLSKRDSGHAERNTQLVNANMQAAENVVVMANNIKLVGTNVTATNGNINMEAVDQLLLDAGEISQSVKNWNNKSGVFTNGSVYGKHEHKDGVTENSTQASNLTAGGVITAKAGAIKVEGSNIAGAKGVGLSADAGDIEITAASTHSEAYTHDKDLTVGLGDIGKNLSRPDKWVKNKNGRATMKFADAQYADVDEKTKITGSQASNIESAEGNIVANASAGKLSIAGSNVTAENGTAGLIGATGVDVTTVTETMDKEKRSTIGSAEMSVVVQHQAAEVVVAALAVETARKKLEQAKKDYKNYERNLDGLQTQLKELESDYAAKKPGVNYDDIVELRQLISDTKGDASFYYAGNGCAAANVTTSVITLAQQIATAAASSGTWGFNAGVQLDLDATKSKTETHDTFETGSAIAAKNVVIQTGKLGDDGKRDPKGTTTNIHGSKINATDSVAIHTGELNVTAGEATHESSTETQHGHITAQVTVYGAAGGASVSGSFDRNKNSERSNTYTNSEISADKIDITTTDDANFRGATVRAESELNIDVDGNLNVESVQNRSSTRSTGMGISGGMSFSGDASTTSNHKHNLSDVNGASGVNGGVNVSNGRSSSKETVLTSLTSGGTATINVKGHTQITGAEIATTDKDGNDLGNLNFTTGSFDFTDLRNTNYSSNTKIGVSANFSLGDGRDDATGKEIVKGDKVKNDQQILAKDSHDRDLRSNTSNYSYDNSQTNNASKTLGTLGHGNISVGGIKLEENGELTDAGKNNSLLEGLNRDTTKIDKKLWSSSTSQSVDVTLDHRMFSEGGRASIKEDFNKSKEFGEDIGNAFKQVATDDQATIFNMLSIADKNNKATQIKNDLVSTKEGQKVLAEMNGGGEGFADALAAFSVIAQEKYGFSAEDVKAVLIYDGSKTQSGVLKDTIATDVKAATVTDPKSNLNGQSFVDGNNGGNKLDLIKSAGHEMIERDYQLNGTQKDSSSEYIADAFGERLAYRLNQATNGELGKTGGATFANNLLDSQRVVDNTKISNQVGDSEVEFRRFTFSEAQILDNARAKINSNYVMTDKGKEQAVQQLAAVSCAAVRCADGVPESDKEYVNLKRLQDSGDLLKDQGVTVEALLGKSAEGNFEYTWKNKYFDDPITKHDESLVRTGGLIHFGLGSFGTVGGGVIATGGAVTCPETGVGCAVMVGGTVLTAASFDEAKKGGVKLFGKFEDLEGKAVFDSTSASTHHGDYDPTKSLGITVGTETGVLVLTAGIANKVRPIKDLLTSSYDAGAQAIGGLVDDAALGIKNGYGSVKSYFNLNGEGASNFSPNIILDGNPKSLTNLRIDDSNYPVIETPFGQASQSTMPDALAAREAVLNGAQLNRGGTLGRSQTAEGQFWSLESALNPGYAEKYGIPAENYPPDFLCIGCLKPGTPFITRPAPGVGANAGGAIEIVTEPGGVELKNFHMPEKVPTQNNIDVVKLIPGGAENNALAFPLKEQLTNESLLASGAKPNEIKVIATANVNGQIYVDTNQIARSPNAANANIPTLISDNIAAKPALTNGSPYPNSNMADAHAEVGVIQQAFEAGQTQGKSMTLQVNGKDVCGYCVNDIASMAEKSGLNSLVINATDNVTKLPVQYVWEKGMRSIKKVSNNE